MTEADEVAASLLPHYMAYKRAQPFPRQGHSTVGIEAYVLEQLAANASYNMIGAVTDSLVKKVMGNRRREDGKLAHHWMTGEELGLPKTSLLYTRLCCRDCGVMKGRTDQPETPCKGIVEVTLRKEPP